MDISDITPETKLRKRGGKLIEPGQVTAIVPTRGNVDMSGIIASLEDAGYGQIIIADNSKLPIDLGIYARFQACYWAEHAVVYTNDDDVIFRKHAELLSRYQPGVLTTAYPQDYNIPWISTGAIFDKNLVKPTFDKYLARFEFDHFLTHKAADAVFCMLTPQVDVVPMEYEELAWAKDAGRVHTTDGWYERDRPEIWDRCMALK